MGPRSTLKKLWWHTTYGEIIIMEQSYYLKQGGTLRPFKLSSGVNSRGYSMPLQRVMTDFAAGSMIPIVVPKKTAAKN